jgi:hypothetical protein
MGWLETIRSVPKHLDTAWNRRFSGPPTAEGGSCESGDPLILMGDWCGEESLTDTNVRNPGIGEEEASAGAVLA